MFVRQKEDLRIKKTKSTLYKSFLKLIQKKSVVAITITDICAEAGVNRSTFYDHFNDKYELLNSLIKDLDKELSSKLVENKNIESAKDYYMKMIELLFDHISNNISIYNSIIKNNNNSIANDMFRDTLLKNVKSYIRKDNTYHGNIPVEIISCFYVSAVINVCLEYIRNTKKYKKEDILNYLNHLIPNNIY